MAKLKYLIFILIALSVPTFAQITDASLLFSYLGITISWRSAFYDIGNIAIVSAEVDD